MKLPYMAEQCKQMLKISSEFVRLQVSHDEYLCMKVLLLLSTGERRQHISTAWYLTTLFALSNV